MSEDTSVFPNAKSKLLGEGEDSEGIIVTPAVAGLTGDLVMSKVLDSGQTQLNGTISGQQQFSRARLGNDGVALITFSNVTTPTEKSTLVIIVTSATFLISSGTTSKNWLLKRDTTTIDTFSLQAADFNSANADIRLFVNNNPVAGTHDYTLVEDDANTFGGIAAQLFFIEGTDTHAGFIDTVAVPGKNIITPDSHRTHEQEVLPG